MIWIQELVSWSRDHRKWGTWFLLFERLVWERNVTPVYNPPITCYTAAGNNVKYASWTVEATTKDTSWKNGQDKTLKECNVTALSSPQNGDGEVARTHAEGIVCGYFKCFWYKIIIPFLTKEPRNPLRTKIPRFLWCRMIRVILDHWSWSGSSQRKTK